jgi:hypothetical protein
MDRTAQSFLFLFHMLSMSLKDFCGDSVVSAPTGRIRIFKTMEKFQKPRNSKWYEDYCLKNFRGWSVGAVECLNETCSSRMIYISSSISFQANYGFASAIWQTIMVMLLMGRIYEVRCWDGPRCHDVSTKILKDWFRHSKVVMGNTHRGTQIVIS